MSSPATTPSSKASQLDDADNDAGRAPSDAPATCEEPKNLVKPEVELEYKVVLLDRQLSAHQDKSGEAKIVPGATRVEISLSEANEADPQQSYNGSHHPAEGAVVTCTPAAVDLFLDEACTQPLPTDGKVAGDKLNPKTRLRLYLRGKTAGKFKLKVELNPPSDDLVVNGGPTEVEMGVVELAMTLHQFAASDFDGLKANPDVAAPAAGKNYNPESNPNDCAQYHANHLAEYHKSVKDLAVPDQKPMTDAERISGRGRVLNALSKGHPSRAKLVIKKLVADQWPDGCDDYSVLLGRVNTSGGVKIFDAEFEGKELRLPVSDGLKVSELKQAEKELWVEGGSATRAPADVQLDLTLDRDAGGLPKEAKRNGDAARFTVVDFKDLKVDFTPEADKPVRWDEDRSRYFVNLAGTQTDVQARTVKLEAQLSEAISGVTVHFMLAPDPKNQCAENSGRELPAGGTTYWNRSVPLKLSGRDASCFEIREKTKLFLVDGMLSIARKPDYEVYVEATYSEGNGGPILRYRTASADNVDSSAGIQVKEYTTNDFPWTKERLWKWDEVAREIKHEDKSAPDAYFHVSAVTDDKGVAKAEVRLSRFGGDVFTPGCYLDQDPHLAKYVEGHDELGKRKPHLSTKKIQVWRRAWLQKVAVEGIAMPDFPGAIGQYEHLKSEVIQDADLVVPRSTGPVNVDGFNPKAIYPRYMIQVNGGTQDALVVSDTNKGQFFQEFQAKGDKPNMIPVLVCDAQWDPDGDSAAASSPGRRRTAFPMDVEIAADAEILDPPLQGGTLFVSGTWKARDWVDATNSWGPDRSLPMVAGDVSINRNRSSLGKVRVSLPQDPGNVLQITGGTEIRVENLVVKTAESFLGESFQKRILAVYDPKEPVDFQNTVAHEVGHAFNQVMYPGASTPYGDPVPLQGQTDRLNIPPQPVQLNASDQGNHCRHQLNRCVMYDSGPTKGSLDRFCKICHPYHLVLDMTKIT